MECELRVSFHWVLQNGIFGLRKCSLKTCFNAGQSIADTV